MATRRSTIRLRPFAALPRGTRPKLVAEAERVLGLLAPDANERSVRVEA